LLRFARESDAAIIVVSTLLRMELSTYLREALESAREGLHKGLLVMVESTILLGTTVNFMKPLLEESGLRVEEVPILLVYQRELHLDGHRRAF